MSYPDIHTCMKLSAENQTLRNKLFKVKHQRDDAQKELADLKERHRVQDLLRNYVTTRDIYVQTEPRLGYRNIAPPLKKKDDELDTDDISKSNKFLSMHSQLMRRYEKEVKQNLTHIETITALNLQIGDLERKLRERTDEIVGIEREFKMLQISSRSKARRGQMAGQQSSADEKDEIHKVCKENKKIKEELEKIKLELKGLDHNFFEEVEDVKYALKQSAKLNKLYEKTLRKTCMQFGIPYPHPEKALER